MIRSSLGQKSDKPLSPSIPSIDPYCANLRYRPSTSNAAKCLQLRDCRLVRGAGSEGAPLLALRGPRLAGATQATERQRCPGFKAPTAVASGASGNLAAQGRDKNANHRLSLPTLAADRLPKRGKGSDQVNLATSPLVRAPFPRSGPPPCEAHYVSPIRAWRRCRQPQSAMLTAPLAAVHGQGCGGMQPWRFGGRKTPAIAASPPGGRLLHAAARRWQACALDDGIVGRTPWLGSNRAGGSNAEFLNAGKIRRRRTACRFSRRRGT